MDLRTSRFSLTTHAFTMDRTSVAFNAAPRWAGGGNAVLLKTDRAGHDSSVKASAAAPSSQLVTY